MKEFPKRAVILAGGFGTRISEESHLRPKPMVEIGGMPIIWHIMKGFSSFGVNEFIVCAGYKQEYIKDWFADYYLHTSDVTFDFSKNGEVEIHANVAEPWKVTVVDTGLNTMTGGRIKRIQHYVGNEPFFLTYGDGVSDVNLRDLYAQHCAKSNTGGGLVATLTAVAAPQRFGVLDLSETGAINSFREKRDSDGSLINGGYMLLEPAIFSYLENDSTVFENEPLEAMAADGKLYAYRHEGFWQCMDTLRDRQHLEALWDSGQAPWKVW